MGLKEPTTAQLELFESCKRGDTEKVRLWLATKKNKRPRTPLNFLRPSTPGSGWICSMRDPNSLYTALHVSALHGHSEICRLLLDADPHVTSTKDRRGCIPLHLAAWSGHTGITQLLTDFEPETVDSINNMGESALHLAAQHGHVKVVGILLDKHSDARLRNARFETALDIAAKFGHAPVCKILVNYCPELALQSAAECSSPTKNGEKNPIVYPLHVAARGSHIMCLQLLRLAGFDIDFVTDEGSALHVAALHGQIESVRYLLREGINPYIRDAKGRTVLEALEEHESDRSNDLTQVMSVKEEWRECRLMIKEYVGGSGKGTLSSSSDSGFDRRDIHERRHTFDGVEDHIWLPVPSTATGIDPHTSSMHRPRDLTFNQERQVQQVGSPYPLSSSYRDHSGSLRVANDSSMRQTVGEMNVNRTWNSRLLTDAVNSEGRVIPRFPLTSPNTKARHQSSKRVSDTLPMKFGVARTSTAPVRGSILPGESCVYRAPPTYDTWHQPRRGVISINGYDNATNAHDRQWDHTCSTREKNYPGSLGPISTRTLPLHLINKRNGETQTLPRGMSHRIRPSIKDTFNHIEEEPATSLSSLKEHSQSPKLSCGRTTRESICSGSTFNCSTLERPSPVGELDSPLDGRAPLAEPEEMIASITNSLVSTHGSPERVVNNTSSSEGNHLLSPGSERTIEDITPTVSERMTSPDDTRSLPSPNTSEMLISDVLFSGGDKSQTRRAVQSFGLEDCHSPTATECSDRTVTSSCSIPMISTSSITPPSISSSKQKDFGYIEEIDDQPLDESAEWKKIDSIMKSIGAAMNNQTTTRETGHHIVRDRHSKALTLLSTLGSRDNFSNDEPVDTVQRQTDDLERWLRQDLRLDSVDAPTMALLLQRNGFDRVEHMQVSLDRLALIEMGVKMELTRQICHYLETCPPMRKYTSANSLNYVSEWLQSLDLQDYLGHFFRNGLKTMLIVRTSDLTAEKLNDIGIYKIGHVLRLLYSLRTAKKEQLLQQQQTSREKIIPVNRNSRLSLTEQLLAGWVNFSAHFLGSVEISNVNSAEEARATMTRLKKALREIAKVPQIRIEISVSGVRLSDAITAKQIAFHEICQIQIVCQDERDLNCFTYITRDSDRFFCHVFCVLTAEVATEIVVSLGQAFECAFAQQQASGTTKDVIEEEKPTTIRTIEC